MEILRWHQRFSVGNQEIDLQHKMLFSLVNYLVTGSGKANKRHEMTEIVEELVAYTGYHFTSEEALLKDHPDFAAHCDAHARFITKAQFFKKAFMTGNEEINGDLFSFLVKWIQEHILKTDLVFFKEEGQRMK
jgi:hemerythrin